MAREVIVKPYYWKYVDEEDGIKIHISGRSETNQSVYTIVEDFKPFAYLKLPLTIKWDRNKFKLIFEFFKKIMNPNGPIDYVFCVKKFPIYLEEGYFLCMTFGTHRACRMFYDKCNNRNGITIDGVGYFKPGELSVHEHNIDPIIKYTAVRELPLANWIKIKETIHEDDASLSPEDRKYGSSDIDLYAKWDDISEYRTNKFTVVNNKFFSFDIECYSKNHDSKLPDPTIPENKIFQIACTIGNMGEKEMKMYLLTLGDPLPIKGVILKKCKNERQLLLEFANFINETDPDILMGFNIIKFDWQYILTRAEILHIFDKMLQITRIIGKKASEIKSDWNSSAYGDQQFRYVDPFGRTNVDVLIDIERNYKLPSYNLKSVGEFFQLEEQKEDVTVRQLFMTVDLTDKLTPIVANLPAGVVDKDERIKIKKQIQSILQLRRCTGSIKAWRDDLMKAKTGSQFRRLVRMGYSITGKYCSRDTVVPVLLCNKLNLWIAMEEISNCMYIPMSYIHTRGQQIKVMAQLYRKTLKMGIVIPYNKEKVDEKYQGATVIDVHPGDYDNVVTLDFESLYPSIIIAKNICYTTLIKEGDPIPDSECNIVPVHEHVGCPHDPQKRKVKKEKMLCLDAIYRYKKVKFNPDGTKENEGILPMIERELLTGRKAIKKEMAKQESILKMATGIATEDELQYYKKMGWKIYQKGELDEKQLIVLKTLISVLNAQQLARKVSANSVYGGLGSIYAYIWLFQGARSVTAEGRSLIKNAIDYAIKVHPGDDTGKGKAMLVYGDTDSCMITFAKSNTEESFELGDGIAKKVSHYLKTTLSGLAEDYEIEEPVTKKKYRADKFPRDKLSLLPDEDRVKIYQYDYNPINLQFENLYKRYIIFTKKRYVAHAVNRRGELTGVIKKGIVLVRRDNCQYLKDTFRKIIDAALAKKEEDEVMSMLYSKVNDLFTRQIPDANLIIYVGVKTLINYAKRNSSGVFVDENGQEFEPTGSIDPRLQYPNIPQVLLARKMVARGDDVPPNTRLEFVYLENENANHQGEKAEDYTYYRENKANLNLKPDYLHYIEKQLSKPVTEFLEVKYPRPIVPFEKFEDAVLRLIDNSDILIQDAVRKIKTYSRVINGRVYNYKGMAAVVQYILDAAEKWKRDRNSKPNEVINNIKYANLIEACRKWKAFTILNAHHAKFGVPKRRQLKPTQTGEKIKVVVKNKNIEAVLIKPIEIKEERKKQKVIYPIGTRITLLDLSEQELDTSIKKKRYVYKIRFADDRIVDGVEREKFTTFYYKDSNVMKTIFLARKAYKLTVDLLKILFDPFARVEKTAPDLSIFETD